MVSEDLLIDINSGSRIEHDWVSVLFQILLSTTMVSEDLLIDITIVHYRGNRCRLGDQQNSGTRKMVHFRDILQARGYSQYHFSQAHEDLVPGSFPGPAPMESPGLSPHVWCCSTPGLPSELHPLTRRSGSPLTSRSGQSCTLSRGGPVSLPRGGLYRKGVPGEGSTSGFLGLTVFLYRGVVLCS